MGKHWNTVEPHTTRRGIANDTTTSRYTYTRDRKGSLRRTLKVLVINVDLTRLHFELLVRYIMPGNCINAEYWERAGKWQKIVQLQQGKSLLYSVQLTLGKADTSWQVFFC